MKEKLIEAAKAYASKQSGGVTINNPELYKAFRDGQDNALSLTQPLKAENERLKRYVNYVAEKISFGSFPESYEGWVEMGCPDYE